MSTTRKVALSAAVAVVLLILLLQIAVPAKAEAKTKLYKSSKTITMAYSSHINSRSFYDGYYSFNDVIKNPQKKATYTAVVKNTKVAAAVKNTNRVIPGKRMFISKGVGRP